MSLNLQNVDDAKRKLDACQVAAFLNTGQSFKSFLLTLKVDKFRKISGLDLTFQHPISVIAGTNTVGKTSILILLACSHEKFMKFDSTSPSIGMREHGWNDMLAYTAHESRQEDYSYELDWRVAGQVKSGHGKRAANSRSWSGLGKKSSDTGRTNAKVRDREVRLIDLERILPGRSFSNALFRKANAGQAVRVGAEIEEAFSYIFDSPQVEISEVANHINKTCFLISRAGEAYSSFNAASGEDSVIYLLKDIVESPKDSLILIDEVEAGFHPAIQRKIADVIQYISWRDKKQFVITTHSPTFLASFSKESRIFVEATPDGYVVTPHIPPQAARSKMDSIGHPLLRLYCEDDLAQFLISKVLMDGAATIPDGIRLVNIVTSGPANEVKVDYSRHKRNFAQYRNKVGCCAIFDGDYINDPLFSGYVGAPEEFAGFIFPHEAPEKFLVKAYLVSSPNSVLQAALIHENHHSLFNKMVVLGLASDEKDARGICHSAFRETADYITHQNDVLDVVRRALAHFSQSE